MPPPGALVQQIAQAAVSDQAGTSATLSLTLGTAVVAGDLVAVLVYSNAASSSAGNHTVSDNGPGYTWHQDVYAFDGSFDDLNVSIFSAIATSGLAAGKTITVTAAGTSGAVYAAAAALEYAGPFPASPLDKTPAANISNNGTGITTMSSNSSGTLGQAIELAVAAVGFVLRPVALTAQTCTGGSGFTARTIAQPASPVGTNAGVCPLDAVLDATTAIAESNTLGTAADVMVLLATYKLAFPPVPEGLPDGLAANPGQWLW